LIVASYPPLRVDDVRATTACAAELTRGRFVEIPPSWRGMRLEVDENRPRQACDLPSRAGHHATSVGQQGLGGADDTRSCQLCQDERRAPITLDVDFANLQAYDPKSSSTPAFQEFPQFPAIFRAPVRISRDFRAAV
jgi:hypothetical protein